MAMLAQKLVSSSTLCAICRATAAFSWRSYSRPPPYSRSTDDYRDFRRQVTALRTNYLEVRRELERMQAEDSTSQAAQEARMEKEREARALEENEKELKRMAEKRLRRLEKLEYKKELKRIHGAEMREKAARELKEKRTQKVLEAIEKSKSFVTPDNLEQKIEEALANEANYNFALSTSGQKVNQR